MLDAGPGSWFTCTFPKLPRIGARNLAGARFCQRRKHRNQAQAKCRVRCPCLGPSYRGGRQTKVFRFNNQGQKNLPNPWSSAPSAGRVLGHATADRTNPFCGKGSQHGQKRNWWGSKTAREPDRPTERFDSSFTDALPRCTRRLGDPPIGLDALGWPRTDLAWTSRLRNPGLHFRSNPADSFAPNAHTSAFFFPFWVSLSSPTVLFHFCGRKSPSYYPHIFNPIPSPVLISGELTGYYFFLSSGTD